MSFLKGEMPCCEKPFVVDSLVSYMVERNKSSRKYKLLVLAGPERRYELAPSYLSSNVFCHRTLEESCIETNLHKLFPDLSTISLTYADSVSVVRYLTSLSSSLSPISSEFPPSQVSLRYVHHYFPFPPFPQKYHTGSALSFGAALVSILHYHHLAMP